MEYVVKKVDSVDITRVDEVWDSVEAGELVNNADGSKPELYTRFKLAYTGGHDLYFLYDVEDPAPNCTMTRYNDDIFDEETVEFFFATKRQLTHYLELEVNALNTDWAGHIDNDLQGHTKIHYIEDNPLTTKIIKKDDGFYVVGKVDGSAIEGDMDEWLFNACRIKRRADNSMILSSFSPTHEEAFHRPHCFVRLTFER